MPEVFSDACEEVGLRLDALSHVPYRNLLGYERPKMGTRGECVCGCM